MQGIKHTMHLQSIWVAVEEVIDPQQTLFFEVIWRRVSILKVELKQLKASKYQSNRHVNLSSKLSYAKLLVCYIADS